MIRAANRPLARTALNRVFLGIAVAVAACTSVPGLDLPGFGSSEQDGATANAQFTRGQLGRVWAVPPTALVMVQRNTARDNEQIIGLENETTLKGDNFLWLNANAGREGQVRSGLSLQKLTARFGEVPYPFRALGNDNLRSASDSLGTYFWQEYTAGGQVNCVLAFRQLGSGARALPKGTRALDIMLRNCVNGSIDDALAPIRDGQINRSVAYAPTAPYDSARLLSPLAGPRP